MTTAMDVTATKMTKTVGTMVEAGDYSSRILSFSFGATFRDSLAIGLLSRLNCGRELFLLPAINFTSLIDPLSNLITSLTAAVHNVIATFQRTLDDRVAGLFAGLRGIEHTYERAQSKPCQKPTNAIAIVISHDNLQLVPINQARRKW